MLSELLRTFATIFVAELPDKTMVATVVLVTRYRRAFWVWVGATGAFAVHVTVAVAAGSAIALLPGTFVQAVVAALFAVGSVVLWRAARRAEAEDPEEQAEEAAVAATARATVIGSFGLVVLAEWGDLTQLATASLAAKADSPLAVGLGAFLGLASVAALAAAFGRQLVERVALEKVNYAGSILFGLLAGWTLIELVRGLAS